MTIAQKGERRINGQYGNDRQSVERQFKRTA